MPLSVKIRAIIKPSDHYCFATIIVRMSKWVREDACLRLLSLATKVPCQINSVQREIELTSCSSSTLLLRQLNSPTTSLKTNKNQGRDNDHLTNEEV